MTTETTTSQTATETTQEGLNLFAGHEAGGCTWLDRIPAGAVAVRQVAVVTRDNNGSIAAHNGRAYLYPDGEVVCSWSQPNGWRSLVDFLRAIVPEITYEQRKSLSTTAAYEVEEWQPWLRCAGIFGNGPCKLQPPHECVGYSPDPGVWERLRYSPPEIS